MRRNRNAVHAKKGEIVMKNMTLENIAKAVNGKLHVIQKPGIEYAEVVSSVAIDSRLIQKDGLFVATRGKRVDGHTFITDVASAGALCVICEDEPVDVEISYIVVQDCLKALLDLAKFYRRQLDIRIVAITGSVGKTTTKEFIASVLSEKYRVHKTTGNHNNLIGLPLTIFEITELHEVAVLEMGISQFGEMEKMAEASKPDVSVMTNIGECHLEYLGSLQGVLDAKSKLLDFMKIDGTLVSNGDDQMLLSIPEPKAKKRVHFGVRKENDVTVLDVNDFGLEGTHCRIQGKKTDYDVQIPLPGQHMIYNALAAVAVGEIFGLSKEEIERGIFHTRTVGSRSHMIATEKYAIIDDCYNANPVSMRAAINTLASAKTRKVAILGDMGELGEESKILHENVGICARKQPIDVLIFIGKLMKYAKESAVKTEEERNAKIYYFDTKEEFYVKRDQILKKGDTILVKASNSQGFSAIVEKLTEN